MGWGIWGCCVLSVGGLFSYVGGGGGCMGGCVGVVVGSVVFGVGVW